MEARYLLPLTCASLGAAVGFLGWQAHRGRGTGPLALGAVAAALVVVGKFVVASDAAVYAGIGALLAASWWSRRWRPERHELAEPALKTAQ
jgi:mercuric ion transport protein